MSAAESLYSTTFSNEKIESMADTYERLTETEVVTLAWGAFSLLEDHVSSSQMANCLVMARLGFLEVVERYIPEDVFAEALRRDEEDAPLLDSEQWPHFLSEHPELT